MAAASDPTELIVPFPTKFINQQPVERVVKQISHYIHQRKRIHQLRQQYPHPDPRIKFLDDLCLVVSVVMPLTAVPQIYKVFFYKTAAGVSLLTWGLCAILLIPMLLYGIVHKAKPIIILNFLWLIADITVVIGVFLYG